MAVPGRCSMPGHLSVGLNRQDAFSPSQAACRAPQAFAAGDGQGDAVERLVVVDERGFAAFGCVQKGCGAYGRVIEEDERARRRLPGRLAG